MKRLLLLLPVLACAAALTGCVADGPGPVLTGGAVYSDYGPGYGGPPPPYYGSGYSSGYGPAPIYDGGGVAIVQTDVHNERDYYYRNGRRYRRSGRDRANYGHGGNYARNANYSRGGNYARNANYARGGDNGSRPTAYRTGQTGGYAQARGGQGGYNQARSQQPGRGQRRNANRGGGGQHSNGRTQGAQAQ